MAQNIVSNDPDGKVTLTRGNYPKAIRAGELVRIGDALTGISVRDSASNDDQITLVTRGVARITVDGGVTAANTAAGKVIYASAPSASDESMATNTASGNPRVGISVSPGATAGNTILVALGL